VKLYRAAVLGTAAVAMIAGVVALVALAASPKAETFSDGFDATASHTLRGPILDRYLAEGGPSARSLNSRTGETWLGVWVAYTQPTSNQSG
jgi:hypothetical protein